MTDYLADLARVLGLALRMNPNALDAVEHGWGPWAVPLGIIGLAAISATLGSAIVLAINQVRGLRLLITLVFTLISNILTYTALGAGLWLAGWLVVGQRLDLTSVIQAVMVAAAPFIFGFLVLLPYSGPGVERALQLWSVGILWAIVSHEFGVGRWAALLLTALGALGMVLAIRTLGRPLAWLRDRLWRAITGRPLLLSADEIRDAFPLPEGESA